MANIMMTDVCNLRCPYCFANEFVNKDKNEISFENFKKAANFILGDGSTHTVGLIGGEPTIHSHFDEFVRYLIGDARVKKIIVYTNGICIDQYWDVICHPKVCLLVNCNSPSDIGQKNYERLCRNLETLFCQKMQKEKVTLGINMYKPGFEYQYILDLLKKYNFHHVRVSITVPNLSDTRNTDAWPYFYAMKPSVLEFFHKLFQNNIVPNFDCNKIPSCLVTAKEIAEFRPYLRNPEVMKYYRASNLSTPRVICSPVTDITQDLKAVRCFGLSEYSKQNIESFKTITDLRNFYTCNFDAYAFNTTYNKDCIGCYARKTLTCNGGCLAFKVNDIMKVQQFVNNLMEQHGEE